MNYRSDNGLIDFNDDINRQLYDLFEISSENITYIKEVLATKAE